MSKKHHMIFFLAALFLLLAEWVVGNHPPFRFDHFGFFLWFGFAASTVLVLVSLLLGKFIRRKDDYYDD